MVWDFRSVVAAWIAGRGPVGRSCGVVVEGVVVGGDASEVWKCERSVWVVFVREMRFWRSLGGAILVHGAVCCRSFAQRRGFLFGKN